MTKFLPRVFCAPVTGFPLIVVIGAGVNKLEWWAIRWSKKFQDRFSRL